MRLFCASLATFGAFLALLLLWSSVVSVDDVAAQDCPYVMGEACPDDYGVNPCNTLAYDVATDQRARDFDGILADAHCVQAADGNWYPAIATPIAHAISETPVPARVMQLPNTGSGPVGFCQSIFLGLHRADVVDVYDVDFLMHSAGCDETDVHGQWAQERMFFCSRWAFWHVTHGRSILRTRELLTTHGCRQFEDGTYDDLG